jgi:hypothetical protein
VLFLDFQNKIKIKYMDIKLLWDTVWRNTKFMAGRSWCICVFGLSFPFFFISFMIYYNRKCRINLYKIAKNVTNNKKMQKIKYFHENIKAAWILSETNELLNQQSKRNTNMSYAKLVTRVGWKGTFFEIAVGPMIFVKFLRISVQSCLFFFNYLI